MEGPESRLTTGAEKHRKGSLYTDCMHSGESWYAFAGLAVPCSPKKSKSCHALLSELPKRTSRDTLHTHSDGLLSCLVFFPFPLAKFLVIFSYWLIID